MVTYRTDDPARWGVGKGSNLTAPEIDGNFWDLAQRLVAVETNPAAPNNIASITVVGSQMTVHMQDGSTHGPFTLPSAMIHYRGDWAPGVSYDELDVVAAPNEGGIYLVARAHTSAATFDRAAVDVSGKPLHQWLFPTQASTLAALSDVSDVAPAGGQSLVWNATAGIWEPGAVPASSLDALSDVTITGTPGSGQLFGWNGTQWTAVDPPASGPRHLWRLAFIDARTGFHSIRDMEFRTAAGVARAATDADVINSSRWGSPERAIDGLTNNYASLDAPAAGDYIGAAFPQFMDVVEFALNPYLSGFTDVNFDIEHSTDGGLTWEVAAAIRGATLADGVWSTFPVAIPADSGGGSTTFLGLTDTPAAFGATGTLAAVNAAGTALEFIAPPSGSATDLTGLSDVTISAPAAAQFLRHNGTEWLNAALAWADIPDKPATFAPSAHNHPWAEVTGRPATIDAIPATLGAVGYVLKVDAVGTGLVWAPDDNDGTGLTALDNLTDVTISAPSSGQVLKFDGTAWVNAADATGAGSADLTGLSDVTITTPVAANFLRHNGTEWVNAAALWADISDKPATFPPEAHTHPWADVTGRPATIDAIPAALGADGQVLKVSGAGLVWAADNEGSGAVSSAPVRRYWRLRVIVGQGATYASIPELKFNGATPTGGVASASSEYGATYAAAKAFDGDAGTLWISATAPAGQWLAYDFGAGNGKDVSEVTISSRTTGSLNEPLEFAIEYSDDDVTWVTSWTDTTTTWSNGQTRTFTRPLQVSWPNVAEKPATVAALPAAVGVDGQILQAKPGGKIEWVAAPLASGAVIGAHIYWRLDAHASHGAQVSGKDISVFTLEFRQGGVENDKTGGVAIGNITGPSNAFDGNNVSNASGTWATNGSPITVGYQFANAVAVDDIRIGTYVPGTWGPATPALFDIMFSDDGISFTNAATIDDRGNVVQEYKAFPIPKTAGGAVFLAKTASYTLTSSELKRVVFLEMDSASANTVTIPAGLVGMAELGVIQLGAGQTSVVAGAGVTLRSAEGLRASGQFGVIRLIPRGGDIYYVTGDLVV